MISQQHIQKIWSSSARGGFFILPLLLCFSFSPPNTSLLNFLCFFLTRGHTYPPKVRSDATRDFGHGLLNPPGAKWFRICCIGAGYVGGPTMATIALKCPHLQADRGSCWDRKTLYSCHKRCGL